MKNLQTGEQPYPSIELAVGADNPITWKRNEVTEQDRMCMAFNVLSRLALRAYAETADTQFAEATDAIYFDLQMVNAATNLAMPTLQVNTTPHNFSRNRAPESDNPAGHVLAISKYAHAGFMLQPQQGDPYLFGKIKALQGSILLGGDQATANIQEERTGFAVITYTPKGLQVNTTIDSYAQPHLQLLIDS